MFCIDLWGFSIDPPYFGYNWIGKPCFVYFDVSGTFLNLNWPGIFRALILYHENLLEHKEVNKGATRPKQVLVVRAPSQAAPL
jgi:hypothetical protein